ncbi:MAG: hypothetical protein KGQ88_05115, partial [Chloroflexi bacterium]|nr:hypothetical protein [Chloroflexota bacterium]
REPDLIDRKAFLPPTVTDGSSTWVLTAEVWNAAGKSPLEFAATHPPTASQQTAVTIDLPYVMAAAMRTETDGTVVHHYYYVPLLRGDRILVLWYAIDGHAPPSLDAGSLDTIARTVGVVP